jgi:hypothetical protein
MDEYVPFDAGPGANAQEDQWRAMMRYQVQNGVLRNVDNELAVYGDSTGMQVKVKTGQVVITGHWGKTTTEDVLPIAAAHATLPRRDLVVARVDYADNEVELDVVTGTAASTPIVPSLTRNTSVWEIPLAVVQVDALAVTIAANKVFDARQWGGPLTSATSDDMLLHGDRLSPCARSLCNGDVGTLNGTVYFIKMQSTLDQMVSSIKFYVTTARVGGTAELKIFYNGWRDDMFFSSVTPTFSNFGMSAGQITTGTFSPISLRAGEMVAVMIRFNSTTTAPVFAGLDVSAGIGANANNLLNAGNTTSMTCGFKNGASMPSTPLSIIDGTWASRDRYFWCALS